MSWTPEVCILYALAVGAEPDANLPLVWEELGPQVLPTVATLAGTQLFLDSVEDLGVDLARFLHGEEFVAIHRPLPPEMRGTVRRRCVDVWDKGTAAVIVWETSMSDEAGQALATIRGTHHVRGAGGFGGQRGPSNRAPLPSRRPDLLVETGLASNVAALFRLLGDWNPLHIDPAAAAGRGYQAPIAHGLCSFGTVGRALIDALCAGDPRQVTSYGLRFGNVIFPGDRLQAQVWSLDAGQVAFQVATPEGRVVLTQGRFTWSPE